MVVRPSQEKQTLGVAGPMQKDTPDCAEGHARLWRMPSATEVSRLAASCGSAFPGGIRSGCCSLTFGRHTQKCCPKASIVPQARATDRPAILNASTSYANGWAALFAERFRFPSQTRCTRPVCSCSFTTTTHKYKQDSATRLSHYLLSYSASGVGGESSEQEQRRSAARFGYAGTVFAQTIISGDAIRRAAPETAGY